MKKCLYLLFFVLPLYAYPQKPLKEKALLMKRFLEQHHYQPLVWNDSAAVLLYNRWIDNLDNEKLFLLKEDITELDAYRLLLDDEMNGKQWGFFDKSTAILKKRVQHTDSMLTLLLSKPFDFLKQDNIVWPFTSFAASEQELYQRWQRYIKWRVLSKIAEASADSAGKIPAALPAGFSKLEQQERNRMQKLEKNYLANKLSSITTRFEEDYLDDIAWCYDPHTNYMNMAAKTAFAAEMNAAELTAGMYMDENDKDELEINYLQPGGSAWRSGKINKGDIIVKLKMNDKEKDVKELTDEEIDTYLNGALPKEIEITVRTAAGETKNVKLIKEKVTDEESVVKSFLLNATQPVGYIHLPGFYSRENDDADYDNLSLDGCANDVSKEIIKLKKDSVKAIILDLRNNGGGSMWEAMQLAGIFIDIGPVASVKEKNGKVRFLKDPNRGSMYDGPLLILVNGSSASASEFLSATLQDYKRALIVGGTTYGKGTAQVVLPMDTTAHPAKNSIDFVKVTGSKFYRINGSTTQRKGVEPDIRLPDIYSDTSFKESFNKSALQSDNSKTGTYQLFYLPDIAMLAARSKSRVDTTKYFAAVNKFIDWYKLYKTNRTVPLTWNGYTAFYTSTKNVFKDLEEKKDCADTLSVRNNSFDWQRIMESTGVSKENNEAYLDGIKKDETIAEAYRILMDWINK